MGATPCPVFPSQSAPEETLPPAAAIFCPPSSSTVRRTIGPGVYGQQPPFCNTRSKPSQDEAISTAHPLQHKYCNFGGLCNDRARSRRQRRRSGWFQTRGEGLPDLTSPVRRVPGHCHLAAFIVPALPSSNQTHCTRGQSRVSTGSSRSLELKGKSEGILCLLVHLMNNHDGLSYCVQEGN